MEERLRLISADESLPFWPAGQSPDRVFCLPMVLLANQGKTDIIIIHFAAARFGKMKDGAGMKVILPAMPVSNAI